jgi:radical SAM superfamily enzyme YgiQ (UPF0313 family)
MRVLLLATYELGRQPFGLASPAAWLRREGFEVLTIDASRSPVDDATLANASLVAIHLHMHTATRLAIPLIDRVRRINPAAHLCCYGLYAPLNEAWLRQHGVASVLGGEYEADLVGLARDLDLVGRPSGVDSVEVRPPSPPAFLVPRLAFIQPDRSTLPALTAYASVLMPDGSRRVAASTEASRGCKHLCRHCPIVPVYGGQFRIVPVDVVMADVRTQVAAGAQHVTFGDPDFFNGPSHALKIVQRLAAELPSVTYDVTIKIEHILEYARLIPQLRETGCLFITSAVESVDDDVLRKLAKGHTQADFARAVTLCRDCGVALSPTFVPFTPWTTVDGYWRLLERIDDLDLVDHVAPIQLAIRLLVTANSALLDLPDIRTGVGPFDPASLTWPWQHRDARVDDLQQEVMRLVAERAQGARADIFDAIAGHTAARVHKPPLRRHAPRSIGVPTIDEPWYCCAEPDPGMGI